jgi:hypothetical protein
VKLLAIDFTEEASTKMDLNNKKTYSEKRIDSEKTK